MPTELRVAGERRALRFALAAALSLTAAYAWSFPLPFIAPLFAVFLAANPGPPPGPRALLGLIVVVLVSLTVGVLLIPVLHYYPLTGIMIVALGLYLAMYLTVIRGKRMLGMFLTVGFTLISVAGYLSSALATTLIWSLVLGITTAVLSLWLVYPLFPDPPAVAAPAPEAPAPAHTTNWLALRATLIVMPAYLLALINPQQYLMTIMKSVSLGQQASMVDAQSAGRELLGSTFAGGLLAVLMWWALSLKPDLWMFFLWMAAASLYVGCKLFRVLPTTVAPTFWINAIVTMLILLGPAVEDSANGKDALTAFLVRFGTFIGVTLYAWFAIAALETWRERRGVAVAS